ncbi:MAG TPA: helix-turn-helix transcriptional regulator [Candidatus Limnocylindrales bacterium]|jgi:transcriptional regulator with XRE-family HTH domain
MNRDESKARGAALRSYLAAHLPVPGARSVTALARKAGIQPTTATSWWTKGYVPDNASLQLLADTLGVGLSDLIAAYEGSGGRSWVFSNPELEALLERASERGAERAVRRVLVEWERD